MENLTKFIEVYNKGTKVERDKEVVAVRKMNGFLAVVSLYKECIKPLLLRRGWKHKLS